MICPDFPFRMTQQSLTKEKLTPIVRLRLRQVLKSENSRDSRYCFNRITTMTSENMLQAG